jgi:hypothetical protein
MVECLGNALAVDVKSAWGAASGNAIDQEIPFASRGEMTIEARNLSK